MRFETKEQATAAATGRFEGYAAVFIGDRYAAISGVERGGWYLILNAGRPTESIAK